MAEELAVRLAKLRSVSEPVRLTTVADEGEAEILCGMLRVKGIRCAHPITDQFLWDEVLDGRWEPPPVRRVT